MFWDAIIFPLMENVLVKEDKYYGQYVAIKDFDNPTVVVFGKDPKEVFETAVQKGYPEPVIVFIPAKDMVQIYSKLSKQ